MTRRAVFQATNIAVDTRLFDISLSIESGKITVVVGENGAGKSSLLDVLAGVLPPARGIVTLNEKPIASMSPSERARKIASIGAGDPGVDDLTVAARISQGLTPRRGAAALIDDATLAVVLGVADELAVSSFLDRRLGELSSGERRRVHVARALVDDMAEVYILDEPHTAVDVRHQALVSAALRRRADRGKTVVVSAHDLGIASSIADRVLGLRGGRVVVDCTPDELLDAATLEKLYGISNARVVTVQSSAFNLRPIKP